MTDTTPDYDALSDQALYLPELFDLMDTMAAHGASTNVWLLRGLLEWGGRHGFFTLAGGPDLYTTVEGPRSLLRQRLEEIAAGRTDEDPRARESRLDDMASLVITGTVPETDPEPTFPPAEPDPETRQGARGGQAGAPEPVLSSSLGGSVAPADPVPGSASALAASTRAHVALREVDAHLNALGWRGPHTIDTDLALAEGLACGMRLAELAPDIGIDAGALKARWAALTGFGPPGIETQTRLLTALRARAAAAKEAAE